MNFKNYLLFIVLIGLQVGRLVVASESKEGPEYAYSAWLQAIENKNIHTIKSLIIDNSDNVDVNQTTTLGESALHIAAEQGDLELILLLIKKDANLEAQYVFDPLCDRDILPQERQNKGYTPLHAAIMANNIAAVELLLRKGASLKFMAYTYANANTEGLPPLFLAIKYASVEMVEFLLSKGIDIEAAKGNDRDESHTPLIYAGSLLCLKLEECCANCDKIKKLEDVIFFLLDKGANFNACDNFKGAFVWPLVSEVKKALIMYPKKLKKLQQQNLFVKNKCRRVAAIKKAIHKAAQVMQVADKLQVQEKAVPKNLQLADAIAAQQAVVDTTSVIKDISQDTTSELAQRNINLEIVAWRKARDAEFNDHAKNVILEITTKQSIVVNLGWMSSFLKLNRNRLFCRNQECLERQKDECFRSLARAKECGNLGVIGLACTALWYGMTKKTRNANFMTSLKPITALGLASAGCLGMGLNYLTQDYEFENPFGSTAFHN